MIPNQAKKAAAARVRRAEVLAGTAEAARDDRLLELRSPAPGQVSYLTNQMANALNTSVEAAYAELAAAEDAAATVSARTRLGTDLVLRYEVKNHPGPA